MTKAINQWVQNLSGSQAKEFVKNGEASIQTNNGNLTLTTEDILIEKAPIKGFAVASNESYTVVIDTTLTEQLIQEGFARELLRAIQEYRKKLNLPVNLRIDLEMSADEEIKHIVTCYEDLLHENLLMNSLHLFDKLNGGEQLQVGGKNVIVRIVNRS